jgi:hypothetical protein
MRIQHEKVFDHVQSIVIVATCSMLVWSDSFEVAGELFGVLQACTLIAKSAYRIQAERVRRKSLPPGVPA